MELNEKAFFEWFNPERSVTASGYYLPPGDNSLKTIITSFIGLNLENIKPFTQAVIDNERSLNLLDHAVKGMLAYSEFQDILSIRLGNDHSKENRDEIASRHYCFYESVYYLRQSFASWLDGNVLASVTLLRPFMELSVMHVYWELLDDTKKYYEWFEGKKESPQFKQLVDNSFNRLKGREDADLSRIDLLSDTIKSLYKSLCRYNHTPRLDDSVASMNYGNSSISLEAFQYYLAELTIILHQMVFLFVLTYPMSLFPVDRYRKFGLEGIAGVYFDKQNYEFLSSFLGEESLKKLKDQLKNNNHVVQMIDAFEAFPDLSEEELEKQWTSLKKELKIQQANSTDVRIGVAKASNRALAWATNYFNIRPNVSIDDAKIEKAVNKLNNW